MRCTNRSYKKLNDHKYQCIDILLKIDIDLPHGTCCCIVDRQECRKIYPGRYESCGSLEKCCVMCSDGLPDLLCFNPATKRYTAIEFKNTENITRYIAQIERKYSVFKQKYQNFDKFIIALYGKLDKEAEERLFKIGRVAIVQLCRPVDLRDI